jgi:pimeloyl-ACP methyl ester carboxylesterase
MFENAIRYLKKEKKIQSISTYGTSMGSLFAALAAKYIGGIDNVILVSPSHVPFEGSPDKKTMTGHSFATWRGEDLPFVKPDFSKQKATKYFYDAEAGRKVLGMWIAYRDAYKDKELEALADIHIEELNSRILMIAGTRDEAWPSDYSVMYLKKRLQESNYPKDYRTVIYPNASHLIGMMPNKERNKWLYRLLPVIGMIYKSIAIHRNECLKAMEASEKEIIAWIKQ